jgi:hypothetical protein
LLAVHGKRHRDPADGSAELHVLQRLPRLGVEREEVTFFGPLNTSPAADNKLLLPAESSVNSHFNVPVVASQARTALHESSVSRVRPPPS